MKGNRSTARIPSEQWSSTLEEANDSIRSADVISSGQELYPSYAKFKKIRKDLDPKGVFADEIVRTLFE